MGDRRARDVVGSGRVVTCYSYRVLPTFIFTNVFMSFYTLNDFVFLFQVHKNLQFARRSSILLSNKLEQRFSVAINVVVKLIDVDIWMEFYYLHVSLSSGW